MSAIPSLRSSPRKLAVGLLIASLMAAGPFAGECAAAVTARRFPENPLLTSASSPTLGAKLNGPSVIRVPAWIKRPLGKYYLYFAHHDGKFIRLAYANSLHGPWTVHDPGTLQLAQAAMFSSHIASPDVHVDDEHRVIRMYFHGSREQAEENQKTAVATSIDGLHFTVSDGVIGDAYFRVFRYRGTYYAIDTHGDLNRSEQPDRGWVRREAALVPPVAVNDQFGARANVRIRHSAVWVEGDTLHLFYSRKADAPERIMLSRVKLGDDWNRWTADEPVEVLRPEQPYEGTNYKLAPSRKGGAIAVQELRDPAVFVENGALYLFYSIAGEMGLAGAEIDLAALTGTR
jgi:hypothetical protein